MNKLLAIFINPAVLVINLIKAIVHAFIKTYKDNLEFFERLEEYEKETYR